MLKQACLSLCLFAAALSCDADTLPADTIDVQQLDEVVVSGNSARERLNITRPGVEHLELERLALTPSFAGERDIIKSITLLPGVRSEGDGGGGFEVRGGNASQNLVLADGITLYNPAHVMGIFSTFNDDALSGATLYKGPVPAMFGGASSSVLETSLKAGDTEQYHGAATVGILAAKIKAEGPVVRDKLSLAVAARRSYVDAFLKMVPQYRKTVMNFYDVSAKIRFTPGSGHIIDGTFFVSRDNMAVTDVMGMYWGNLGASLNWVARPRNSLTFVTTASLTHFDPKMEMDVMNMSQMMRTYIHDYSVNERMRITLGEGHVFEAGLRTQLFRVKSAEWMSNALSEREVRSLWSNALWACYARHLDEHFDIDLGVRLNIVSVMSGAKFHDYVSVDNASDQFAPKTYVDPEPRISARYAINGCHNIKAAFGMSSQNLHAIRSSSTSMPFDRYALTSATVKPERATQYGIGYSGMTTDGMFDWSVEGYWRDISNVYDYKDGLGTFSNINLESIILGGRGRSYGAEVMLRKNNGRLNGWISYTLSRTRTRIPGINDNRWYNAVNDRRHDFSITAIYNISDRWNISALWIYQSGQPLTAPDVKYEIAGQTAYYYSQRNAYKTPPIHRLDLAATYTHTGRRLTYEWSFGIFNTYCRYNPYMIYFEDNPDSPSGTRAVQVSMYGLIPSVSYTLKF